jgi:NTE family protein
MFFRTRKSRPISLALQGGGAHGAFTWGVLDALLEDGRVDFEGISGTSAGAMNAIVLAAGMARDGRDGARQALQDFWREVSEEARLSPIRRSPIDVFMGNWNLDTSPALIWFDLMSRLVSPYEFNPLNLNPLQLLVERAVDFDGVHDGHGLKLFVAATNVRTGRVRVFTNREITADVIMASACLPHIYQAVEVDGEHYWDGGYMGNPVLFPFFYECDTADIMLVQINPIERPEVPETAREIFNRVNEITFNSSLIKELRAVEFVTRLIDDGHLDTGRYMRALIHRIDGDKYLRPMSASSKLNAEWDFLTHLRDLGRETTEAWLEENFDRIGVESTLDLRAVIS